jgi:hypothetical protein
MFSVITNIYNKKTKGPTLMELFTATRKMKKLFHFSCGCEQFHSGTSFGFLVINVCNHGEHYETPCINICLPLDFVKCFRT